MKKKVKLLLGAIGVSTLLLSAVACSPFDSLKQGINDLFCQHEYSEYVETKAPTCDEVGEETRTCNKCGKTETQEIEALEHNFGEYVETKAPTCTKVGEETRTCNNCGKTELHELEMLEHNYGEYAEITAPTCTMVGEESRVCNDCGKADGREIEMLEHNFERVVIKDSTCTESGLGGYMCSCGEYASETEEIPAIGHNFVDSQCWNCGEVDLSTFFILPASDGYLVDGDKLTFEGTNELTFVTTHQYSVAVLEFSVSDIHDTRGAFQIGWGVGETFNSINEIPFVQFNYDRAVIVLPDGTKYDTSWQTGNVWRLIVDGLRGEVQLMVDDQVVYQIDSSALSSAWSVPSYLCLRTESNCALTFQMTNLQPSSIIR